MCFVYHTYDGKPGHDRTRVFDDGRQAPTRMIIECTSNLHNPDTILVLCRQIDIVNPCDALIRRQSSLYRPHASRGSHSHSLQKQSEGGKKGGDFFFAPETGAPFSYMPREIDVVLSRQCIVFLSKVDRHYWVGCNRSQKRPRKR